MKSVCHSQIRQLQYVDKVKEAWNTYNNHSFYMTDVNRNSSACYAHRVYPESKKRADTAKIGDLVVLEDFHLYNFNGSISIENDINKSTYKKVQSTDIPKLLDINPTEKTVSEAIVVDMYKYDDYSYFSYSYKYYTILGSVVKLETDNFYMAYGTDTICVSKCLVNSEYAPIKIGDFVKVTGIVGKSDIATATLNEYKIVVGVVVNKTKTCYITKNTINGTIIGPNYDARMSTVQLTADPNYGYHFTKWSDDVTNNPRTILLTQDTTFTAIFAIDRKGRCGDNNALSWEYDAINKILTISGSGTLNSNYTFGIEASNNVEKLVISEGVTEIGSGAFSGYTTLKEIYIASTIQTLHEQAFYNCTRLENIYVYRNIPSTAYSNTFDGINKFSCTLHVLQSSIDMYNAATGWRDFYYKEAIDAISITEPLANVEVNTTENTAEVTWPIVASAESYDLIISKEGEEYCTLRFNDLGQLIGISFAPSMRNNNQQEQTTGFRFIVTGLSSKTQYSYSIVAKDASNTILNTETGTFSTLGGTITNVENMTPPLGGDKIVLYNKVLKNGQIYILRGEKIFTLQGAEVK